MGAMLPLTAVTIASPVYRVGVWTRRILQISSLVIVRRDPQERRMGEMDDSGKLSGAFPGSLRSQLRVSGPSYCVERISEKKLSNSRMQIIET